MHQTIYTLGGPLIKAVIAGSGHLLICTCNPCLCLLGWCEPWGRFLSCASALNATTQRFSETSGKSNHLPNYLQRFY
jgi:hypothetical protein